MTDKALEKYFEANPEELLTMEYMPHMSNYSKTLLDVIIDFLKLHSEIRDDIKNGLKCDQNLLAGHFHLLENFVDDLRKSPPIHFCYERYQPEADLFFCKAYSHLFDAKTEVQQKKQLKEKEIVLITKLFEFYVNSCVDISLHSEEVRTNFLRDFMDWYRDCDGNFVSPSTARGYIKESSFFRKKDQTQYQLEILINKDIVIDFFDRNDIQNFQCYYPEITNLFNSFYQEVMSLIHPKRNGSGLSNKIYLV